MADIGPEAEAAVVTGNQEPGESCSGSLRRCRGRPRLPDSDRAQRRLESRKKYDVRRVYLGQSHRLWSELRRRTGLSDSGLAEYLVQLDVRYGGRYRERHGGKQLNQEACPVKQKQREQCDVNCLHSLVSWYEEHRLTCPHEPQLRSLEPGLGFSTSALWQCQGGHGFHQHLSSPDREASDSENESHTDGAAGGKTPQSQRRKRGSKHSRDTTESAEDSERSEDCGTTEVECGDVQIAGETPAQSQETDFRQPSPARLHEREAGIEGGGQVNTDQTLENHTCNQQGEASSIAVLPSDTNFVVVTTTDPETVPEDSSRGHSPPPPPPPAAPLRLASPGELYEQQTLETVVASCQIADGEGSMEGSQVIIITGSSYEALASEGIHLDVGGSGSEGVSCTVIEGVTYSHVCETGPGHCDSMHSIRTIAEIEKEETDESLGLLETPENTSEEREMQTGSRRSKRSRRGPVIEADGMLKMFHCPYEGCRQVYVAMSSFQNHVNLVHRKGRTKVCPHPGCGKKFYLSNHLHRHMIIHSGVRDFICETCGKSFKRKNHLEVHRRTHTGETPLQCEVCGYQCRQRASLNWHMKKHKPELHYNFTCEQCGKRFEKLESVKFHKLKSHPDKQAV
ncbi:zinc finger protein 653-like [Acipenser ruthenus]|uniref:zinc finger protein 653-like n=1 Tax=Acipenser ruthenus TaxID=7906 RepID=UPI0027406494|nr:zinc finger protein 653-like [Acipenser ruthenus]